MFTIDKCSKKDFDTLLESFMKTELLKWILIVFYSFEYLIDFNSLNFIDKG